VRVESLKEELHYFSF